VRRAASRAGRRHRGVPALRPFQRQPPRRPSRRTRAAAAPRDRKRRTRQARRPQPRRPGPRPALLDDPRIALRGPARRLARRPPRRGARHPSRVRREPRVWPRRQGRAPPGAAGSRPVPLAAPRSGLAASNRASAERTHRQFMIEIDIALQAMKPLEREQLFAAERARGEELRASGAIARIWRVADRPGRASVPFWHVPRQGHSLRLSRNDLTICRSGLPSLAQWSHAQ
jgi:hypothetical protein